MGKMKWVIASCLLVLGVVHGQEQVVLEAQPVVITQERYEARPAVAVTTTSQVSFEPLVAAQATTDSSPVMLAAPRYVVEFAGAGPVVVRHQRDMAQVEKILTRNALHYQQVFPWIHNSEEPLPILKVRYFPSLVAFQQQLVMLTNEVSLAQRIDFMTIEDSDGTVVLYMYEVTDQRRLQQMLNRHGFVQFNMATAPATPAWVREGFALYFEDLTADLDPLAVVSSRSYLRNLHELGLDSMMFAHEVLTLTEEELADPAEGSHAILHSWALVNFLTQAFADGALIEVNYGIRDIFMQALRTLDVTASFEQAPANTVKLANELNKRLESLDFYFSAYLTTILNHQEAYERGVEFFRTTDFEQAVLHFEQAAFSLAEYYQPNYVLGILASYRLDVLRHKFKSQTELYDRAVASRNVAFQNSTIDSLELLASQMESELTQMKDHLRRAMDIIDQDMSASTTLSHAERRSREEFRSRIAELYRKYEDGGFSVSVPARSEPLPPRSMTTPY